MNDKRICLGEGAQEVKVIRSRILSRTDDELVCRQSSRDIHSGADSRPGKNERIDFCPHCGIGLFDRCGGCKERKSAFSLFCHACGAPASRAAANARPATNPQPGREKPCITDPWAAAA